MTTFQKIVKYFAMALAVALAVSIIGGILGVVGLFDGFFKGEPTTDELKTYSVSDNINKLKVEINAADFIIKQGDNFLIESNLKTLTVDDKDDSLTIKESKKIPGSYSGALLTLYVPSGVAFEKVNVVTGAGKLTVENLMSDKINFELGAGEVNISNLVVNSKAKIEGGAGKITVLDGVLTDLDVDMGIGQLNLTSCLLGECEFDLGVGESNITVIGNKSDYKLDVEKGIGNVSIDGQSVPEIKNQGNGNNSIEINGGIGAINLSFIQK